MSKLTLPSTAELQSRRSWQIQKFYGVDYSTPKFSVDDYHSIDAQNLIRREEALQKRFGYKQVADLKDKSKVIHNVFRFVGSSGNEHYIANVSGSLYEIGKDYNFNLLSEDAVLDEKVSAFPSNDRLYILGGIKYLVVYENGESLQITPVLNSQYAYVPTTTIGITPVDLDYAKRTSLDDANLLTYWRKNKLITGLHYTSDENTEIVDDDNHVVVSTKSVITNTLQEYPLDTPISYLSDLDMANFKINLSFYDGNNKQFNYNNATQMNEVELRAVLCGGVNLYQFDETYTEDSIIIDENLNGIYILVHYADNDFKEEYKSLIREAVISFDKTSSSDEFYFKVYGYVNLSGSVVLFNDYANPNGENNMTVYYPYYDASIYETSVIDKCHIGIVYNANNINSLFVCGNSDYPARDWHSEELNASALSDSEAGILNTKDLVYFPDNSYCDYGEDNKNPIYGYDLLGTGDLVVFKQYQRYEPTIYFRSGQLVAVSDDYGKSVSDLNGTTLYKQEYSLSTGNIGKSLKNYGTICNFNGDTLFIANDNTIQGLDKETKAYDNQRYANSRSQYIDVYLKNKDLTNSGLFFNEDYLYFYNNNEIFVNKYGEYTDTTSAYEWYDLKYDINIKSMFELFDDIYFSDDSGKMYLLFNKDKFVDEKTLWLTKGEAVLSKGGSKIVINASYWNEIEVGDKLVLDNDFVYKIINSTVNETLMQFDFREDYISSSNHIVYRGVEFIVHKTGAFTYSMSKVDDTKTLSGEDYSIYLMLREVEITSKNEEDKSFGTDFEFANITITPASSRIVKTKNVKAHYITSPILFDSSYNIYYKNIWSIMVSDDTGNGSEMSVDLVDNKVRLSETSMTYSSGFTLDNLSFEKYSLEKNEIPVKTYTIFRNIVKKEYICLKLWNYNDTNLVVSRINFTYSVGGVIR